MLPLFLAASRRTLVPSTLVLIKEALSFIDLSTWLSAAK
jgi:hypothetical protein